MTGTYSDPAQVAELHKLEADLDKELGRCLADFRMLSEGDRVMVCMNGGKDNYGILRLLEHFRRRAPIKFELLAVHLVAPALGLAAWWLLSGGIGMAPGLPVQLLFPLGVLGAVYRAATRPPRNLGWANRATASSRR